MRKAILPLLVAAAAVGLVPTGVQATNYTLNGYCVTGFNICFDFGLTSSGNTWTLTTKYLASSSGGTLTGIGIEGGALGGLAAGTASGTGAWTVYLGTDPKCSDLIGSVQICAESNPPPVGNGIAPGQQFAFTFTSTSDVGALLANGTDFITGHVQQFVVSTCSVRFATDGSVTPTAGTGDCAGTTVPEPISMSLIGTGLIGLGFIRRRRKGSE